VPRHVEHLIPADDAAVFGLDDLAVAEQREPGDVLERARQVSVARDRLYDAVASCRSGRTDANQPPMNIGRSG